jgi:hypothetical protein
VEARNLLIGEAAPDPAGGNRSPIVYLEQHQATQHLRGVLPACYSPSACMFHGMLRERCHMNPFQTDSHSSASCRPARGDCRNFMRAGQKKRPLAWHLLGWAVDQALSDGEQYGTC